jgi:alpha/beta superfamily hydrolase
VSSIQTVTHLFPGAAGAIETLVEMPGARLAGIALVAHPHPFGGGANTNKIVHTLARAFLAEGFVVARPNFRGVGQSEGAHDEGFGETDDLLVVLDSVRAFLGNENAGLPVALAGFSFGAYCQTRVAERLSARGERIHRMVLVGVAAGFVEGMRQYDAAPVPAGTLVMHGEKDSTVPLANVLAWAAPQNLPVVVVPGADHFFHGRLAILRDCVRNFRPPAPLPCG